MMKQRRTHTFHPLHFSLLCALCLWLIGCAPAILQDVTAQEQSEALAPQRTQPPTLDDFWTGNADFEIDVPDTGLPMGESDTLILADGKWRSYLHASHQSLGVIDQCGAPVEFPGCLVTFTSIDQGRTFSPTLNRSGTPVCQIPCTRCPCDSRRDHIDQQQYPRVERTFISSTAISSVDEPEPREDWILTYEYRANTIMRRSSDGLTWSSPAEVPLTGIWRNWLMPCHPAATIGAHPYAPPAYDCLVGSPPGLHINSEDSPQELYLFVGLGQNPSSMGCLRGPLGTPVSLLRACDHNPLFTGSNSYGAREEKSASANAHFDFRTISSADVLHMGDRYYLFYEGVRGPTQGDHGDTQFLVGLARSLNSAIDGPWELFPGNPILLDLPGNVGVGHADVVVFEGVTYLYTSLDGVTRSRLQLVWQ